MIYGNALMNIIPANQLIQKVEGHINLFTPLEMLAPNIVTDFAMFSSR